MPETDDGATDFVLQGDLPLQRAQAALAAAEASGDGHAMADAHLALDEAGAFDARARAQALLLGLGFRVDQLDAPVNSFSGGWRMRLQLARALMCPADLLLLDEPTNHLDLDALVWLEAWLQALRGHDDRHQPRPRVPRRDHPRHACTSTRRTLTRYTGNYSAFEEMRAERLSQAAAAFGKQQERIAHLQRFIDRFKAKASKAKQAQSRVKALARMEKLAPVLTAQRLRVRVPRAAEPAQPDAGLRRPGAAATARRAIVRGHQPLGAGRPAHRHPRRQRPGQVDAGQDHRPCAAAAGRHDDRRQGPGRSATSRSRSWTCCSSTTGR